MEEPIRILMNEDDVEQIALNEHELRRKGLLFTTRQVSTQEEFLKALDDFKPDIILTDYSLPTFDAPTALRLVQERKLPIPVIIVTGSIDEETAAETIKAGAMDYVLKQRLVKLAPAVEAALERAKVFKAKAEAEEALKRREYEFRTLVETSPDIIARYDRRFRHIYINPAIEQIAGIPRNDFIGKTNRQLGMEEDTASYLESILQKAFASGREVTAEYSFSGPFGKRYFLMRVVPEYFSKEGIPESVMSISRDITSRKTAEEHVKHISFHDSLTGLYNRLYFEEELNRLDKGRELPISIIMGDVNFLKISNDTFGHEAGDQLLKNIADVLKSVSRDGDVIARWGGDEFTMILPRTGHDLAGKIAGRIAKACSETPETMLPPSVALGVATKENDDENVYRVLRDAEEVMYKNKLMESKGNIQKIVTAILNRIGEKYMDAREHAQRLQDTLTRIGKALGLSAEQAHELSALALFHDMGKITVPEAILLKKGKLAPGEWDIVKTIPEVGYRIAKSLSETTPTAEAVLSLRERWDGKGYPKGLKEEEIPFLARVLAVIDAYDVMTHPRPYEQTFSPQEAVEELRLNSGTQFDPDLVNLFTEQLPSQAKELVK